MWSTSRAGGARGFLPAAHGPHAELRARQFGRPASSRRRSSSFGRRRRLHTQWPGDGEADDPATLQFAIEPSPAIEDFGQQQPLVRDALIALLDKIGPSILMTHSQGGAFGWPVADIKAGFGQGDPGDRAQRSARGRSLDFIGAPDYFKDGALALTYGVTAVALSYVPAVANPAEITFVKEDKPDGPGLVTCWKQTEPARQLPNLQKMPILVLTGRRPITRPGSRLHGEVPAAGRRGSRPSSGSPISASKGNSHVMMLEKNNKEIAAVMAQWLGKALPGKE